MTRYFDLAQTSYWLLLVWLFGAGALLCMMPKKKEIVCGQLRERYYWFTALLLVAPYVLWTGYRSIAGDTYSYVLLFRKTAASFSAIPGTLFSDTKDPGFTALMMFVKACGIQDYQHFFLLMAALQMFCLVYTLRRYSNNFWFSFFLFIASTDYVSWMQNGMRQFLAVCMTFAAFDLMVRRKYIRFALIVLLAMQIHGSAVIMLPIAYAIQGPPLNRKTILIIIGTIPIVLVGYFLQDYIRDTLRSLWITAIVLIVFGLLLGLADLLGRRAVDGGVGFHHTEIVGAPHVIKPIENA
jgi:transmembrane protein EpsG